MIHIITELCSNVLKAVINIGVYFSMLASEQELKCFGKKEPKLEVDFVMKITKHQTWGRQLVIYQNVHSFSG